MKRWLLAMFFVLTVSSLCFAQNSPLLIDDFEGPISGGPQGTVDFGAGNGSSLEVSADKEIKNSGTQSLKAVYNAVPGGYMWIARGQGLDAANAAWLAKPEDIKWGQYKTFSFYLYGNNSKEKIAVDIKDNGNEIWRSMVEDNFTGWKKISCPLSDFFVRGDWQPDSSDKNGVMNFPLKSYQFEPLPEAKGALYFDTVYLE